MKLCRFQSTDGAIHVGLLPDEQEIFDLGPTSLATLLESDTLLDDLEAQAKRNLPRVRLSTVRILPPVERQEVWAAGVTYLRSKKARMEESDFSATAYDRVYEAPRPEIFFKSMPDKVVAAGEPIGIRADARWSVPEPE